MELAGIPIRQDYEGRYCLKDLHKAAGGEVRHSPNHFFRLDSTGELCMAIVSCTDVCMTPFNTSKGGKDKGTYVVRELVYAYAMWISPQFHLKVIRAYDTLAEIVNLVVA